MSTSYLALLRGINVGGKNIIKMDALRATLSANPHIQNVRTYIQSGNVLFESELKDTAQLARLVQDTIVSHFAQPVGAAVFSKAEWQAVIGAAPESWGKNAAWKHNLLVMVGPYDMQRVTAAIGTLKPDIEACFPGQGVLYQSISWKDFGKSTGGKLASNPIYKHMTIRNFNTATKLLGLL